MIILRKQSKKFWNSGKHYFSSEFYQFIIKNLIINFTNNNKDLFILILNCLIKFKYKKSNFA